MPILSEMSSPPSMMTSPFGLQMTKTQIEDHISKQVAAQVEAAKEKENKAKRKREDEAAAAEEEERRKKAKQEEEQRRTMLIVQPILQQQQQQQQQNQAMMMQLYQQQQQQQQQNQAMMMQQSMMRMGMYSAVGMHQTGAMLTPQQQQLQIMRPQWAVQQPTTQMQGMGFAQPTTIQSLMGNQMQQQQPGTFTVLGAAPAVPMQNPMVPGPGGVMFNAVPGSAGGTGSGAGGTV